MSNINTFISFPSEDRITLTVGDSEIDFRTGKATIPNSPVRDLGNRISQDEVLNSVLFSSTEDVNVQIYNENDIPYQGLVPAGTFKLSNIEFDLIKITTTTVTSLFLVASTVTADVTNTSANDIAATGIGDGRQVVAVPGFAVALAASTIIKEVTITAETNNVNPITVGNSTVVGALATRQGTPLLPGDSITLKINDLAKVFIDVITATEGVTYTYLT